MQRYKSMDALLVIQWMHFSHFKKHHSKWHYTGITKHWLLTRRPRVAINNIYEFLFSREFY